ncbi:MAG: hypothetical protein GXO91_03975 [FCB group bacterium]|nr:hypothetical protein [FCB group bacterium]
MKIRTNSDLKALDSKIQKELGIDLKAYRDKEMIDKIINLISFPTYAMRMIFIPVAIALILFGLGLAFLSLTPLGLLFYFIPGLILFFFAGLLSGLLLLNFRMKKDIHEIMQYALDLVKRAVEDMKLTGNMNRDNRKQVYGMLFTGIVHLIILPTITHAISDKIPIFGSLINRIVKRIFIQVCPGVDLHKKIELSEIAPGDTEPRSETPLTLQRLQGTLHAAFSLARIPVLTALIVVVSLLMLLMYCIGL